MVKQWFSIALSQLAYPHILRKRDLHQNTYPSLAMVIFLLLMHGLLCPTTDIFRK